MSYNPPRNNPHTQYTTYGTHDVYTSSNRRPSDAASAASSTEYTSTSSRERRITQSNSQSQSQFHQSPLARDASLHRNTTLTQQNRTFIERPQGAAGAAADSSAMQRYAGTTTSSRHVSTVVDDSGQIAQQEVEEKHVQDVDRRSHADSSSGLKLRLDVNLDVEVELKAKIRGDLTLALL
ncbi:hypothetical protein BJX64DRAFT_294013 [Aspergillus heterothallicus]